MSGDAIVVIGTISAVCICVLLHYEILSLLSQGLSRLGGKRRRRVLFGILGVLSVHVAEIWIFGFAFTLMLQSPELGTVLGATEHTLLDYVYISAMTFTTIGLGDIHLAGSIRFLAGTEALTGLVLITWSASFTFLEMEHFWRER